MPYSLETCYLAEDSDQQLSALADAVDAAADAAQADIDALLADPELQSALASYKAGVKEHDAIFTAPGINSVDDVLNDLGMLGFDPSVRDIQHITERKGYMFVDGNAFLVNQLDPGSVTQTAPPSTYSVAGLGKGIENSGLDYLGYAVSADSQTKNDLIRRTASYNQTAFRAGVSSSTVQSTTGTTYIQDGNVSSLREVLRACGGDFTAAEKVFAAAWTQGYAIVWSHVASNEMPVDASDIGDYDKVRANYSYPVFDEQVTFYSDLGIALVCTESFVGVNITREAAVATAYAEYKAKYGIALTSDPVLVCRVFRFCSTNVINTAPIFITRGFDASLLGRDAYALGMSVSGYTIIVDVTGDRGTGTIGTYTANSVAACITAQLSDILTVVPFGGELIFTAKTRGSSSFIKFFDTLSSAATAMGIDGAIADIQATLSSASPRMASLRSAGIVTMTGGSSSMANMDMSTDLLSEASKFGFTEEQQTAVVTGDYYWTVLGEKSARAQAAFLAILEALDSATSPVPRKQLIDQTWSAMSVLSQDVLFMDIPQVDYRMLRLFRAAFGDDGLLSILVNRTSVYDVSINIPVSVVYAYLGKTLDALADSGGVQTQQASIDYISPFRTNSSLVWKVINELDSLDIRYATLDEPQFKAQLQEIVGLAAGVRLSSVPITEKADDTSLVSQIGDFALAVHAQDPDWTQGVLDTIAAASVVTIPEDWLRRQEASVNRQLQNLEDQLTDIFDNAMSGLISTLGLEDELQMALRQYRRLLAALKAILRILKRAQDFVRRQQVVYNNMLRIVNAAVNYNLNMYGSFAINTKFLSCYASGTASAMLSAVFGTMVALLNKIIDTINKGLEKLMKAVNSFFNTILCALNSMFSMFSATLSYESTAMGAYTAMGIPLSVQYKLKCTVSLGFEVNSELTALLGQIQNQINALLASMKLGVISWQKQATSTDALKASASGTLISELIQQLKDKLDSLTACFS